MFFVILLAILTGILFGTFTGLIPGIHINLISVIILTFSPLLLQYAPPLILSIVIISMAITHTFLDTIPSVFLGAPEADTALSILPGHRLLLKGRGFEAVMLTVIGSLCSLILAVALSPIIVKIIELIYPLVKAFIGYLLIIISIFLILREQRSKFWAFTIFLLSGSLGLAVFSLSTLKEPLFPLFSGMFGISMLVLSLKDKIKIPKQEITEINMDLKTSSKALGSSIIASGFCSFMPGLGPAQAAILGSMFVKNLGNNGFLVLVGGLNTVNMVLSFIALYIMDKARNGAIVVVSKILTEFGKEELILFLGCSLVVAGVATFLASFLSKAFAKLITKLNYQVLCISIISLIVILVYFITGVLGLFVLLVASFVGVIPPLKNIGRNHMMGSLIIPVILYFLL